MGIFLPETNWTPPSNRRGSFLFSGLFCFSFSRACNSTTAFVSAICPDAFGPTCYASVFSGAFVIASFYIFAGQLALTHYPGL